MQYTREQIEAYQKELKEYVKNKYSHRRLNFSIGEEFLEHKFPKKLPEEGLLVADDGVLVYRTGEKSGYGFNLSGVYIDYYLWTFVSNPTYWKPATPEQKTKFVELLKKECEKKGLYEDTKLEDHAKDFPSPGLLNQGKYDWEPTCQMLWNKNGVIFYNGKFATPRKEELPEEGLLVSDGGSLVYKLSDGKGYGFSLGRQSCYLFDRGWNFSIDYWKPATPEQKNKFVEMLKIECEKHLLFEDTKIDKHADGTSLVYPNCTGITPRFNSTHGYNRNGLIFYRGKFATPRKEETTLTQISKAIKESEDFSVERTESGLIILTPKNK